MAHGLCVRSASVVVASFALAGCGGYVYVPRPSPRIQVVPEGNGLSLVKNGRTYSMGALGGNVDEAVAGNPHAEDEARTYKSLTVGAFVLNTIGGASAAVGAGLAIYDGTRPTSDNGLLAGALTAAIGGLTLTLVGTILASSAHPHLWNAVNLYNDGLPAYPPAYPTWQPQGVPYGGYPPYGAPPLAPLAAPITPAPRAPAAPLAPLAPPGAPVAPAPPPLPPPDAPPSAPPPPPPMP